jgi:hypothetical protein
MAGAVARRLSPSVPFACDDSHSLCDMAGVVKLTEMRCSGRRWFCVAWSVRDL